MITVGRTANNDVALDYPCVSKFHAFFTKMGLEWTLTDSGSTNGTYLDDKKVTSRVSASLRSDAEISFSNKLKFRFVDSSKMFNYLDYFRSHVGLS